jgi:methylmalonyl-CoA mutase cobalamin-binding subunit
MPGDDDFTVPHSKHYDFTHAVADALRETKLEVREQPIVGSMRPDLVVADPEGHTVVIDVKTGPGADHFGSIAQVAKYRKALQSTLPGGVAAMLVIGGEIPEGFESTARDLGVDVVSAPTNSPTDIVASVSKALGDIS